MLAGVVAAVLLCLVQIQFDCSVQAIAGTMSSLKIADVVKAYNGDGDVTAWVRKLKLAATTTQQIKELASIIPMFLEGPAFAVYEQMDEKLKTDADAIERALVTAFSMNPFQAYESFRLRSWQSGEPVDVYLSELRRLAKLAGVESDGLLVCAFVVGLPIEVSCQLRAAVQISKTPLPTIVE